MSMKKILRGCIYYADLEEGKGSEQSGKRPVIIIQNDFGNSHSPTTIIAVITSQTNKRKLPTHIPLSKENFKFLDKDSIVMCEQIRTIDKSRLIEYKGKVDDYTMMEIITALQTSFAMYGC
ncbi:type II toxin-antitoxin system PemK/MazF family toxin [Paraclostridium sordellii]|uniref:type II toxin-antitoxin system PemK/MazF family toxin n=1 Tax=Paraclostridium sordellii TaxID=1505 RepID=UPI00070A7D0D